MNQYIDIVEILIAFWKTKYVKQENLYAKCYKNHLMVQSISDIIWETRNHSENAKPFGKHLRRSCALRAHLKMFQRSIYTNRENHKPRQRYMHVGIPCPPPPRHRRLSLPGPNPMLGGRLARRLHNMEWGDPRPGGGFGAGDWQPLVDQQRVMNE